MLAKARSLCSLCSTLRWQDARDFGGLRDAVLARDGWRCRAEALDRGPSPGAGPLGPGPDDRALSGVPRKGAPHARLAHPDAALAAPVVARAAPGGPGAEAARLPGAAAGGAGALVV